MYSFIHSFIQQTEMQDYEIMALALKKHNVEYAYHFPSPSLLCFWLALDSAFTLGQIQEPVTNHEIYTGF